MEPTPLLLGVGEHVTDGLPEPEGTIPGGQDGSPHAAAFAVAEQVRPRLRRFPEPVSQRDQLLVAINTDPDHHQQTDLVLLEAHLHVDPVDPHIHVVDVAQAALAERVRFVLPLGGQPGDHGRRQGQLQTRRTAPARGRSRHWPGRAGVQQRQHVRHLRRLTRPRWQDRRREPHPLPGSVIGSLVVDPGSLDRHRTGRGGHLAGSMRAVPATSRGPCSSTWSADCSM